jgi:hypothetical protein
LFHSSKAIESALRAEWDGVRELQRSQKDARDLLAQTQAGPVAQGTGTRISKPRTPYHEKVQRDIQRLEAIAPAVGPSDKLYDSAEHMEATRRVAAGLTGVA